jgi:hypothetical protein
MLAATWQPGHSAGTSFFLCALPLRQFYPHTRKRNGPDRVSTTTTTMDNKRNRKTLTLLLQHYRITKKMFLQPLVISFPFSWISSQWLHFLTPIGKDCALGEVTKKAKGKNTLWQDPQASGPSTERPTQHGALSMIQGMIQC